MVLTRGSREPPSEIDPDVTFRLDENSHVRNSLVGLDLDILPPTISGKSFERKEAQACRNMDPPILSACCRAPVLQCKLRDELKAGKPRRLNVRCQECGNENSFVSCLEAEGYGGIIKGLDDALAAVSPDQQADSSCMEYYADAVDDVATSMGSFLISPSHAHPHDNSKKIGSKEVKFAIAPKEIDNETGELAADESPMIELLKKRVLSPIEFEELERLLAKAVKKDLVCPTCLMSGTQLQVKGVAGKINRAGVRRLAIKCLCGSSYFHLRMEKCSILKPKLMMLKKAMDRVDKDLEGRSLRNTVAEKVEEIDPFAEDSQDLEQISSPKQKSSGHVVIPKGLTSPSARTSLKDILDKMEDSSWDQENVDASNKGKMRNENIRSSEDGPSKVVETGMRTEIKAADELKTLRQDMLELQISMKELIGVVHELRKDNRLLKEENAKLQMEKSKMKPQRPDSGNEKTDYSGTSPKTSTLPTRVKSYAEIAASRIPLRRIMKLHRPAEPKKPQEEKSFGKCHMKLNMPRDLKKLQRKVIYAALKRMFETLGIERFIMEMSLVGRSVCEIYYKIENEGAVLEAVGNTKMLLKNFDLMTSSQQTNKNMEELSGHLTSRLMNLVERNRSKAFRETIFEGVTDTIRAEVMKKVDSKENKVKVGNGVGQESKLRSTIGSAIDSFAKTPVTTSPLGFTEEAGAVAKTKPLNDIELKIQKQC